MKKQLIINGEPLSVDVKAWSKNSLEFELEDKTYRFQREGDFLIQNQRSRKMFVAKVAPSESKQVFVDELEAYVEFVPKARKAASSQGGAGSLQSPMPGKIFKVLRAVGEEVKRGDPVIILEAMKMEHTIKAQQDGVVKAIHYAEGAQVQGGVELCEIE